MPSRNAAAALRRAEQVNDPPASRPTVPIGVAEAEEAQRLDLREIRRVDALQRFHVEAVVVAVDEGPDEAPVLEEMDVLRRREDEIVVPAVEPIGRQELADQDRGVKHHQHHAGDDSEPVALQLPPHHAPLRGEIVPLLLRGHLLDGMRIERLRRDVVRQALRRSRRSPAGARLVASLPPRAGCADRARPAPGPTGTHRPR